MGGMDDELEPQTEPEEIPFAFPASQATTPAVMHVDPSLIDTKYLHVQVGEPSESESMSDEEDEKTVDPRGEALRQLERLVREKYRSLAAGGGGLVAFDPSDAAPYSGITYTPAGGETLQLVTFYPLLDALFHYVKSQLFNSMAAESGGKFDTGEALEDEFAHTPDAQNFARDFIHPAYWYVFAHLPGKLAQALNELTMEAFLGGGDKKKAAPAKLYERFIQPGARRATAGRLNDLRHPPTDEPEPVSDSEHAQAVILHAVKGFEAEERERWRRDENLPPGSPVEVPKEVLFIRLTAPRLAKHAPPSTPSTTYSVASMKRYAKNIFGGMNEMKEKLYGHE
jgi:hypothetical protein